MSVVVKSRYKRCSQVSVEMSFQMLWYKSRYSFCWQKKRKTHWFPSLSPLIDCRVFFPPLSHISSICMYMVSERRNGMRGGGKDRERKAERFNLTNHKPSCKCKAPKQEALSHCWSYWLSGWRVRHFKNTFACKQKPKCQNDGTVWGLNWPEDDG